METGKIKAGGAFVEISARTQGFMKSLNAASAKLKAWGQSVQQIGMKIAAVGAASAALLASSLRVFVKDGDQLAKMSQRTGVAVEALSALGYAATQSGMSMEQLEQSMRFLQKQGGNASVESLMKIADELAAIEDPSKRAAKAMEYFGRAGTAMLPMMADGGRGMRDLMERARELGLVMDGDAANAAVRFGDNMADVGKQVRKTFFEIGASLAPALEKFIVWFQKAMKSVIDWVRENRAMVTSAFAASLAVTAFGASLIALGVSLKLAGVGLGLLATAGSAVVASMAAAKAAVLLLLTPVGALGAAVAGVSALIVKESKVITNALKWIGDRLREVGEEAKIAFDAVKSALANGDIGKAAAVFWAFIKLEWERGTAFLTDSWVAFRVGFLTSWNETTTMFAKMFVSAIGAIEIGLSKAKQGIQSFFSSWISNAAEGIIEVERLLGIIDDAEANQRADMARDEGVAKRRKIAEDAQRDRDQTVTGVQEQFKLLDQESKAFNDAQQKAANDRVNKSMKALEDAQAEFKQAVNDAKVGGAGPQGPRGPNEWVSDGEEIIEGIRASVRGTFNARAIQSLQGTRVDKVQEKIADGVEEAADHLRELLNILRRRGNPAFI
jgi:hypothetical protein